VTQDSNAGERNEDNFEPEAPREPTPQELQHAREMQEIADGHRYMPQEMRDAREAAGKKPERPKKPAKSLKDNAAGSGERIAKVLARAGLASRREIERLIGLGKISVNGRILETPAVLVSGTDVITVDGQVVGAAEPTRLWRYHKPVGLVTTERDPEGRPTVFDKLPADLPRVLKVGRLDLNSEGLLLLTNDGELARALELPSAGWVRRYRARALGHTTQARLDSLRDGTTVEGVIYGPIEATLDKMAEKADGRANCWITVAITEGKNREVRRVLESIGLKVNRLIRLAYGPFQLGNLEPGEVEEIGPRVIREMLADVVQLRNLPVEGASQTQARPGRSAERGAAPAGRRGGGDRFTEKPRFGDKPAFGDKKFGDKKPANKAWTPREVAEKREFKERDFDQRPRFEGDGEARDRNPAAEREFRPRREFGGAGGGEKTWKPRPEGRDRAEGGEKKAWTPRPEGSGERKSYGAPREDRPKRDYGDRPQGGRSYGDKPAFKKPYAARSDDGVPAGEAGAYERAKREFGGPREERPKRDFAPRGDRPQGDRPAFKKPYAAREGAEGGERRSYMKPNREGSPQGDKPAFKKPYASRDNAGGERAYSDRPKRDYGDRPAGDKPAFKKPYASRDGAASGERPAFKKPYASRDNAGGERAYSDRPKRDYGDRPAGDKPAFKKPYASRDGAAGGERKSYGDKPRPAGGGYKGKPSGDRPSSGGFKGRPSGDRPSGGKPPFKPRRDS
jgi:23S rRNA pseudouridine2605 synthase